MILAIRTDKPESELYLLDTEHSVVDQEIWLAHRKLSETIITKIESLLARNQLELADITRVAVFTGPGSFTGLRIGITVANTLAYSRCIPIIGVGGEDWLSPESLSRKSSSGGAIQIVTPDYGAEANITKPRK